MLWFKGKGNRGRRFSVAINKLIIISSKFRILYDNLAFNFFARQMPVLSQSFLGLKILIADPLLLSRTSDFKVLRKIGK